MSAAPTPIDRAAATAPTIDARVALVGTLGYLLAITLTPEGAWGALALLALPVVGALWLARVPPRMAVRRSLVAAPFLAAALPLLVTRDGDALATLPPGGWEVTDAGVRAVGTILAQAWISVLLATALTHAVPQPELLRALRALRVPALLVAVVGFAYRFLFLVQEEARRMLRARRARQAAVPGRRAGGRLRWRATVAGRMVGTLFVRSHERSERVYTAMLLRGYAGETRLLVPPRAGAGEVAAAAACVAYAWGVQLAVRGVPGA